MYTFGRQSREKLSTANICLYFVMTEAIKTAPMDFAIICGHRGKLAQDRAQATGKSTVSFPNSKHNTFPSNAIDFVPWHKTKPHVRWEDKEAFKLVAKHILDTAVRLGHGDDLTWGGHWRTFVDMPHIQTN